MKVRASTPQPPRDTLLLYKLRGRWKREIFFVLEVGVYSTLKSVPLVYARRFALKTSKQELVPSKS